MLLMMRRLALRYKDAVSNYADAEHSNNIYKFLLSRRRCCTSNILKSLLFLYHNQQLESGLLEVDDQSLDTEI